MLLLRIED